jgi:uncharacterized membrane protein
VAAEETFSERETPGERAFDYDRTVALSDGVFAIALTLLVLSLTVPHLATGHQGLLGNRLSHQRDEFISYGISFAVIARLWIWHHRLFRALERIDTRITLLNLAYLAFVALLPFPTRVLGAYGEQAAAIVLYASTVAVLTILGGLTRAHALRAGLLDPKRAYEVADREHWALAPAVFLASIPIAFADVTLAKLTWLLLLVPAIRARTRARARAREPRG